MRGRLTPDGASPHSRRMVKESSDAAESVSRGVSAVLAAAAALPSGEDLADELEKIREATVRGYFPPDDEERVRLRYTQYLALRAALLETVAELGAVAGRNKLEWAERLPVFTTAFAAACILMRATRYLIDLAAVRPVLWKKLDEEDVAAGLPAKSFTRIYQAATGNNQNRFLAAADFHFANREAILRDEGPDEWREMVRLLADEEPWIERRRRDALRRSAGYRWFSFLRGQRSAWRRVMLGFFELSGRAIAEMRQPGMKPRDAPKRISTELRAAVLDKAKPGDLFATRHDDAMSNLFLPGFWPHAALYLGDAQDAAAAGFPLPEGLPDEGPWFLEAKKDGVKIRSAGETLQVDALVLLRSPLEAEELAAAVNRALGHRGKPYDFLFDFRRADRLACTEVIYRGFHGIGPIRFELREVGGRLCLPAEELLNQALDCGFRLVVTAGLRGNRMLGGMAAEIAFHSVRQPV